MKTFYYIRNFFHTELRYNSDYSTILYILHGYIEERNFLQTV
jgi:hypothetical protein